MSLFDIIDKEAKELLLYNIFIITRHCKRVEIHVMVEELSHNKGSFGCNLTLLNLN